MIRKSGNRFPEKIMLKQRDKDHDAIPLDRIMIWRVLAVIKSSKVVPKPFPKRVSVGTYASHPRAFRPGLPSQEAFGRDWRARA
jgi:hypothetical protein